MDDGMKRFARLARKVVRDHVRSTGEPPKLTMWASNGPNPRQAIPYEIGRARDTHQVRQHAVDGLHEAQSRWCAIGKMQVILTTDPETEEPRYERTNQFGMIVLGAGEEAQLLEVEIINGHVGAWRPWESLSDDGENTLWQRQAMIDTFRFAQATLERIDRAQREIAGEVTT